MGAAEAPPCFETPTRPPVSRVLCLCLSVSRVPVSLLLLVPPSRVGPMGGVPAHAHVACLFGLLA